MSNTWGNQLKLSIFGESHGKCIGMTLSGVEAGITVDPSVLEQEMKRRAPGNKLSTSRQEADQVDLVSGVMDGKTTGSPITGLIYNTNTRSADYDALKTWMRPSHADYPAYVKYHGFNDHRGGGHFSGRLTAPLVAAGSICSMALKSHLDLTTASHILQLYTYKEEPWDIPDKAQLLAMKERQILAKDPEMVVSLIQEAQKEKNSIGGMIQTAVLGIPAGLGDPFFDSLESRISSLLFSIPAVKGVLFGAGEQFASSTGRELNDAYKIQQEKIVTETNHNGGILGGISTGMPVMVTVVVKPTPSIGTLQHSVDISSMKEEAKEVSGRHDPCIVLRAIPVIEACLSIALYDAWLTEKGRFHA